MIGAIIGDIVGSRFEFNNHLDTDFELFHPDCTFTDDTICTIAVADWLMHAAYGLPETMRAWCRKYPSSYGGMFQKWVYDDGMGPYNSFGNGSAMRVSPVGWVFEDWNSTSIKAKETAIITHNHDEGVRGAKCIATSIYQLRKGLSKKGLKNEILFYYGYGQALKLTSDQIRKTNRFDETCQVTVPQAIVCFLESKDFEDAIRLAVSIGGDSDTIAAITGSLAEAHYGIPADLVERATEYLPDEMNAIIKEFKALIQ